MPFRDRRRVRRLATRRGETAAACGALQRAIARPPTCTARGNPPSRDRRSVGRVATWMHVRRWQRKLARLQPATRTGSGRGYNGMCDGKRLAN